MQIARTLRDYLEVAGFDVTAVGDGSAAIATSRGDKPDLIVLDLGLPGMDGLDVARELRRTSTVPIVMLTARGEEADRIVGLELGADDYLVKPFSPKELVARVRAVLRRANGTVAGAEVLRAADIEVDLPKMRARVSGRPVDLTPTEFELLTTLVREPGRVFTRGQLLDALRGVTLDTYERAIDAHVKNLRKKIEPEPGRPRYVLTVHGGGSRSAEACRTRTPARRPAMGIRPTAVDARRTVRRRSTVPARRSRCLPVGGSAGRGARKRRRVARERDTPEALHHHHDRGARARRAHRHRSVVVAKCPLDRFPDGRGRSGRGRRLCDARRRGAGPVVSTARRRLRRNDDSAADERGTSAGAPRRRRARAAHAVAGDPRCNRGHARRAVSRRRRAPATLDRAHRRHGATPR